MYYNPNPLIKSIIFILLSLTLLISCSSPKTQPSPKAPVLSPKTPTPSPKAPVNAEIAMRTMAKNLLTTALTHKELSDNLGKIVVILESLVDAQSGDVVENISQRIEQMILKESQTNFDEFVIHQLTPQQPHTAQYTIRGQIDFNHPERTGYHRISVSMSNLATEKVLAESNGFVSAQDFDYTPPPKFKDTPKKPLPVPVNNLATVATSMMGQLTNKKHYDSLGINALLKEAETLYGQQDYEKSFLL